MAKRHFPTESDAGRRKFDAISYPQLGRDDHEDLADIVANFWYYDLSFRGGDYCFNNPKISLFDYQRYFEVMQVLSDYSIGELLGGTSSDPFLQKHSFHEVKVDKYPKLRQALKEHFGLDRLPGGIECPLIYQIGLYNSNECTEVAPARKKAPRVFFRLTDRGAFSVFFLDLYHELCPQADRSSAGT